MEDKIKRIEELLAGCKALKKKAFKVHDTVEAIILLGKCNILKAAIRILKEPSNIQMHTGELTCCPDCSYNRVEGCNFCPNCGRNYAHR